MDDWFHDTEINFQFKPQSYYIGEGEWELEIWTRTYFRTDDPPNRFYRFMHRLLLGMKWKKLDD